MFKNLSKKYKKIINISLGIFMGSYSILSFGLVIPGMGVESLNFINSVEKQLDKILPEGKFVLNGQGLYGGYQAIVESSIKTSYEADVISSLSSSNQVTPDYAVQKEALIKFADNWYEKTWGAKVEKNENIDLHDVGKDFVDFDQAVATKFHSFGFVNTGIQWLFHSNGLNEIFSKGTKQDALMQQTVIDQSKYEKFIKFTGPGMGGVTVQSSLGTYIVNNKVWFLNLQRDTIKYALESIGSSIFVNDKLTTDDIGPAVTPADLNGPNFTQAIATLQAGVVLFFIMFPLLISGSVVLFLINKKENK